MGMFLFGMPPTLVHLLRAHLASYNMYHADIIVSNDWLLVSARNVAPKSTLTSHYTPYRIEESGYSVFEDG